MSWAHPFQVLRPSGPFAELDRYRARRPSVLEGRNAVLRMWYGGDDGTTSRVLVAEQRRRMGWARLGVGLEPGAAGATDAAGTGAPSVVRLGDGVLMAYVGSDGTTCRVHFATSPDGETWHPEGPFAPPGGDDAGTAPCLVARGGRLWLYYGGAGPDGRPSVLAAVSTDGRSWSSLGPVLGAADGEDGVSEPCVVEDDPGTGLLMFVVARDGAGDPSLALATSTDGETWERRAAPLGIAAHHPGDGPLDGPGALRMRGGRLRLWYAAGTGDGGCRLWSTDLIGKAP